jgi:hypothetical protein
MQDKVAGLECCDVDDEDDDIKDVTPSKNKVKVDN